jgi:hypothetical protein
VNVCIFPRRIGLALFLGALFLLAPPLRAGPLLPLDFQPGAPIVSGSNGDLTYNASTDEFKATLSGPTLLYASPSIPNGFALISGGSLTIDLFVSNNGNFVANGTGVTLSGSVTINGAVFTGTLLAGTVTAFGSDPAGPPSRDFDGLFTVTGGALTQTETGSGGQSFFGGFPVGRIGAFGLIGEDVTSGTLGDFTHNFSSDRDKPLIGVVPEPSTLALVLTGATLFVGWRKRRTLRGLLTRKR